MSDSLLIHQVRYCAERIGFNDTMRTITNTVWLAIEQFTARFSEIPKRLEDLNVASVARFIETRSEGNPDVESLLLELTCVRLILLESGFSHNELTQLSVRVRRERLVNDKSGKYQFAKRLYA
ncbi:MULTISPECIES: hypothetical protein [Paraburkholderia]|uniref:Uncharacterized protein n=1 Tax=Paraburkholderia madseniana TaxID=2599607 RepID=A0AAP5BHH4_9BURK|nr:MULTISPECIES: hypothetical protein [Paraburkholderia]MCX4149029.1 hypothetical protein [Paraburkholderia madseniana]MDN7151966.1 hypothetical protein [Paraburkholderia sp. WS6]MDQ6410846.1 hypothetical protein [Paraburkholderia madseniana]